ncbi:unnamed protein product [Closterium sp. Yama58-4]|nr:unnamed protein product [Closterium sp. Yama58-4]
MRNKSIAFIGDSLGQQQFQSLLCLLSPHGPPKNMSDPSSPTQDVGTDYGFFQLPGARRPTGLAYRFVASNTTVIFRWTTCLCEIEPLNKEDWTQGQAMHLDRPDTFLRDFLRELDVVVLNTGHHWNRGKMKESALEFYLNGRPAPPVEGEGDGEGTIGGGRGGGREGGFGFGYGVSGCCGREGEWDSRGRCDYLKHPFADAEVAKMITRDAEKEDGVFGTTVHLLNITHLSAYRGDAHPSSWDARFSAPKAQQDCLHWCLPGVPDTWNELLYTHIMEKG